MKIIDKQKDYYDYLQGVFGQDPLAVYDRRGSIMFNAANKPLPLKPVPKDSAKGYYGTIELLCGLVCHRYYFENMPGGKVVLEGMEIFRMTRETSIPIRLRISYSEYKVGTINPYLKFPVNSANRQGFPIRYPNGRIVHEDEYFSDGKEKLWDKWYLCYSNPILSSLPLMTLPPDCVFEELHEFLLSLNEKNIEDTRTDVQKLESAGFDKKTSFRKM